VEAKAAPPDRLEQTDARDTVTAHLSSIPAIAAVAAAALPSGTW